MPSCVPEYELEDYDPSLKEMSYQGSKKFSWLELQSGQALSLCAELVFTICHCIGFLFVFYKTCPIINLQS